MSDDAHDHGFLSDEGLGDWPGFGLQSDVRPVMARALADADPFALVTLHAAEGPAPHGMGAQMLIGADHAAGFLSGGCIEGDVALHARAALQDGEPRRLIYGRGGPPDIRLLCGSRIELLVEPVEPDDPAAHRLVELTSSRQPGLWLSDGVRRTCLAEGEDPTGLPTALRAAFEAAVATPAVSGGAGGAVFRRHDPVPLVVAVGADPTALALVSLARQMGWDAAIVRPKGPPTPPPIAGVTYLRGDPAVALHTLKVDAWTAIAATSHDIESDGTALAAALPSPAAYVGVLGSRKRIPERLEGLRAAGVPEVAIARLKAPIGLPIKAQTPWEIAVSILAEVVADLKARQAERTWPAPQLTERA
jgi:xanthine dehydrogenase accessory factor